jgi:hypothetical protein
MHEVYIYHEQILSLSFYKVTRLQHVRKIQVFNILENAKLSKLYKFPYLWTITIFRVFEISQFRRLIV